MTETPLVRRALESELFGCPVYFCETDDVEDVRRVLAVRHAHPGGLIVFRVQAAPIVVAHEIEAAGGRLCDILITFTCSVDDATGSRGASDASASDGASVLPAAPEDGPALEAIAARAFDSFGGHWHADPRLPRERSTQLYQNWCARLAADRSADARLLTANGPDGRVLGFIALARTEADRWEVPLAAVDTDRQGRGLFPQMLRAGMRTVAAAGGRQLDYVTQATNLRAVRALDGAGFSIARTRLTFHLWTARP